MPKKLFLKITKDLKMKEKNFHHLIDELQPLEIV